MYNTHTLKQHLHTQSAACCQITVQLLALLAVHLQLLLPLQQQQPQQPLPLLPLPAS